jgi:SAM-dependent MidA family methyltransferase
LTTRLEEIVRERGPMTVAAFMDLALYDPAVGYYARASQRSGRTGDFFTSVDVGPLFGDLLELQIAEMAEVLDNSGRPQPSVEAEPMPAWTAAIDLVEAGAGNGRLSADILRAARDRHPALFDRLRLHLVEASAEARREQAQALDQLAVRLASSTADLPESFEGILLANELLDAMPVHQVVMTQDGLREVYVRTEGGRSVEGSRLATFEGPLSTPEIGAYLDDIEAALEPGWTAEVNLHAMDWLRDATQRLRRGFIVLIDYGHEANVLYSASHAQGTLTSFSGHVATTPSDAPAPMWLRGAGEQDLTSHVDFTSVRRTAERAGLSTLGFLDQTYFVLGLVHDRLEEIANRHALKTLMMPGGLGSTHKVLILGKAVGSPSLRSCSFARRVT